MPNENQNQKSYEASYSIAKNASSIGNLAKIAAFVSAALIAFMGLLLTFIVVGSYRDYGIAFVVFLIVLTLAAVVGFMFYGFGVLLLAIGEGLSIIVRSANHSPQFGVEERM